MTGQLPEEILETAEQYGALRQCLLDFSPTTALDEPVQLEFERQLKQIAPGMLRKGRGTNSPLIDVGARWTPEAIAEAIAATSVDTSADGASLAVWAREALPFLDPDRRNRAAEAAEKGKANDPDVLVLRLAGLPLADQIDLMLSGQFAQWPEHVEYLFSEPVADELETLFQGINFSDPGEQLWPRVSLSFLLLERFKAPKKKPQLDWALGLARDEPHARRSVLRLAMRLKAGEAARLLRDEGWRATPELPQPERFMGSDLLLLLPDHQLSGLLDRLDTEALTQLYVTRLALSQRVADVWAARLRAELCEPVTCPPTASLMMCVARCSGTPSRIVSYSLRFRRWTAMVTPLGSFVRFERGLRLHRHMIVPSPSQPPAS